MSPWQKRTKAWRTQFRTDWKRFHNPHRRLKINVALLLMMTGAMFFLVYVSLSQLFFRANHLSQLQIATIQITPFAMILVLDIQTGHLADRWSYRGCIRIGAVLMTIGFAVWTWGPDGYFTLLVGAVIQGAGSTFIRGANVALASETARSLVYDVPDQRGRRMAGLFETFQHWTVVVMGLSEGSATLLALFITRAYKTSRPPDFLWYFGHTAPEATVGLQAMITGLLILLSIGLKEVRRRPSHDPLNLRPWHVIKAVLGRNPLWRDLRASTTFGAVIGAATLTMVFLAQAKFEQLLLPAIERAVWWLVALYALGVTPLFVWLYRRFTESRRHTHLPRRPYIAIAITLAADYLAAAWLPGRWALLAIPLFRVVWAIQQPLVDRDLRESARLIPATAFSVRSTLQFTMFGVIYIGLSLLVDAGNADQTLPWAFTIAALVWGVPGVLLARRAKRVHLPHSSYAS